MRHPRNPLLRVLSLLVGIAVIVVFVFFGLVVFSVLLIGGVILLALRCWKLGSARVNTAPPRAAHAPDVLEGEFVVIERSHHVTH